MDRSGAPNAVRRARGGGRLRSLLRHRAFLLSLAIIPQALALGALAGVFWTVRVKEIVIVPARAARAGGAEVLECAVAPRDPPKLPTGARVEVELLNGADGVDAAGEGAVTNTEAQRAQRNQIVLSGEGLSRALRQVQAQGVARVRLSVRTRRALTVLLEGRGAEAATRRGQ